MPLCCSFSRGGQKNDGVVSVLHFLIRQGIELVGPGVPFRAKDVSLQGKSDRPVPGRAEGTVPEASGHPHESDLMRRPTFESPGRGRCQGPDDLGRDIVHANRIRLAGMPLVEKRRRVPEELAILLADSLVGMARVRQEDALPFRLEFRQFVQNGDIHVMIAARR